MAKMTVTYSASINGVGGTHMIPKIINGISSLGRKYNFLRRFVQDGTQYLAKNPVSEITILDSGDVQITSGFGRKRAITRTRSKLLKIVNGLKLV